MQNRSFMLASKVTPTNYSAISNLPKNVINQIKYEGEIYCQAPEKCEDFWKEMRRSDFTSGAQLSFKLVDNLFDKYREDFNQLLKVQNSKDFFELFDQDNDGFLNEDEQILVFSVIKEKMIQVANSLLRIQEYISFKQLMKQVRSLEFNINEYQNELRQKIYKKEVQTYAEIGQEKLEDFYDLYYNLFQQLEDYKKARRQQLSQVQQEEVNRLEDKLSKDTELLKVKPKKKLKDLQTQEKLVSLDERVEEALDFRRELKDLEKNEQNRVHNVQQARVKGQHDDLEKKFKREKEQLELKLVEHEHKLIIQMKKDYDVLLKKINLHSNEIERIQGLATKQAVKKGLNEGELKRTKNRAKLQNNIIGETKAITKPIQEQENPIEEEDDDQATQRRKKSQVTKKSNQNLSPMRHQSAQNTNSELSGSHHGTNSFFNQPFNKTQANMVQIKKIIKSNNYTAFYIRKKFGADLPVNFKQEPHQNLGDNHQRIEKILMGKKKSQLDVLPSLTDFYDGNLKLKEQIGVTKTDEELLKEKMKKRNFINEKLQNGENNSLGDSKKWKQ